jgi:uncharacterized protein DUF6496
VNPPPRSIDSTADLVRFLFCGAHGGVHVTREEDAMPEKKTVEKAKEDLREGKSASTAAGEFVHEEIDHIRQGKHGARSTKQAIAIGLSKARRAGVPLPPPKKGRASERTRQSATRDYERGRGKQPKRKPSRRRSKATTRALERESKAAASKKALSRQAKSAAARRRRRGKATSTEE